MRTNRTLSFTLTITSAALLTFFAAGCKHDYNAVPATLSNSSPDPALANMAPVSSPYPAAGHPTRALGQQQNYQPQQQSENYGQQQEYATDPNYDQGYNDGENRGQTYYESNQAPPPLEAYQQPPAPGANYIWTPGYWGYDNGRYVWINGAWTRPPYIGALWTPPYWAHQGSSYRLHHGYWGRHVGYYGGIDYGSGYIGTGYYGGYWTGDNFYYNRSVNRIVGDLPYVYNRPVFYGGRNYGYDPLVRISFNGIGGIGYAPSNYEFAAMRESHVPSLAIQVQGFHTAYGPREGYYGQPIIIERHDNGWHGHHNDVERGGFGPGDFHGEGHGHDEGGGHDKHDHGEGHGEGHGKH